MSKFTNLTDIFTTITAPDDNEAADIKDYLISVLHKARHARQACVLAIEALDAECAELHMVEDGFFFTRAPDETNPMPALQFGQLQVGHFGQFQFGQANDPYVDPIVLLEYQWAWRKTSAWPPAAQPGDQLIYTRPLAFALALRRCVERNSRILETWIVFMERKLTGNQAAEHLTQAIVKVYAVEIDSIAEFTERITFSATEYTQHIKDTFEPLREEQQHIDDADLDAGMAALDIDGAAAHDDGVP
jgi:hypothetical protein